MGDSEPEAQNRISKFEFARGLRLLLFSSLVLSLFIPWKTGLRAETKPALALFPFLVERGEDPGRGAICPICKGVYRKGDIPLWSRTALNRLVYQKFERLGTFQLLPNEKMEETLSSGGMKGFEQSPVSTSIRIGKKLNADYLLLGFIARFEERVGSALGVEKPASVAFDLHLYRVKDIKMVWEGRFDETQRPLSENLLKIRSFFKRKAAWLTAEELASSGLDEMLKRLPSVQELEDY